MPEYKKETSLQEKEYVPSGKGIRSFGGKDTVLSGEGYRRSGGRIPSRRNMGARPYQLGRPPVYLRAPALICWSARPKPIFILSLGVLLGEVEPGRGARRAAACRPHPLWGADESQFLFRLSCEAYSLLFLDANMPIIFDISHIPDKILMETGKSAALARISKCFYFLDQSCVSWKLRQRTLMSFPSWICSMMRPGVLPMSSSSSSAIGTSLSQVWT